MFPVQKKPSKPSIIIRQKMKRRIYQEKVRRARWLVEFSSSIAINQRYTGGKALRVLRYYLADKRFRRHATSPIKRVSVQGVQNCCINHRTSQPGLCHLPRILRLACRRPAAADPPFHYFPRSLPKMFPPQFVTEGYIVSTNPRGM